MNLDDGIIHDDSKVKSLNLLLVINQNVKKTESTGFGTSVNVASCKGCSTSVAAIDDDGFVGELVVNSGGLLVRSQNLETSLEVRVASRFGE
jgi:hypothetical protein